MKLRAIFGLAIAALFGIAVAQAAPPQVTQINPGDLFQDVVNGSPQAGNVYASALQLAGYGNALPSLGNALIGGDAVTNLWQRATTGASVTTTLTYGGPDRWAYWSGTSTAMTVSRDSTAADLPLSGYAYAFKMARTSGQTGVVQMCMAQEVESVNSYQFQGQTAELDFHATAGANFSAASSNLTAYVITGTGVDEGLSKMAFAFNAGGGGSSTWAGQANATAAVIPISTITGRYAAVATIPTTATEIGVVICYTPVGTAGTNDYVALSGIQLVRNSSLAGVASATVGYNCGVINCAGFDRRSQGIETSLQQRYFYELSEAAVSNALYAIAPCAVSTTSLGVCTLPFPVTMRVAPTMSYTTGFGMTVAAQTSAVACTALATGGGSGLSLVAGPNAAPITCASSTGFGAAGTAAILTNMASTSAGVIKASAEL
jgi:hypothetical protein